MVNFLLTPTNIYILSKKNQLTYISYKIIKLRKKYIRVVEDYFTLLIN